MRTFARCAVTAVVSAVALIVATPGVSADRTAAASSTVEPPRPAPAIFSGDYKDAPARDILMDIARTARLNAVLPSNLTAKVTAHFDKMPIREALAYVASLAEADYRIMDRTLTFTARKVVVNARPAETVVKAPAPETTSDDVMREARRIDNEELEYVRPRAKRSDNVRVETYINVQTSPLSPSAYAGATLPYWPPLSRGGVFGGQWGGQYGGQYGGTVWLPNGVAITPLPSPIYVMDRSCRW